MLFSSISFLYYFLPAVLTVYFLAPKRARNAVLLVASLVFYGWGEPKYLALMAAVILAFFGCGLAIEKCGSAKGKKFLLVVSVTVGAALLVVFKYADLFLSGFNAVTGLSVPLLKLALPIGISFYIFQCVSYTADVYRGQVAAQRNLLDFGAYVALFPQLIAGPIVRYADIAGELSDRHTGWEDLARGLRRFLAGLGKKVILANNFGALIETFRQSGEKSVLFYWMYAAAFMLQIYFDFSGYSDMAIGLGRVFGFHFPENFNYPYCSRSITEFWRRWHMTLGQWFRDYVYIPLGGSRVRLGRWVCNILAVWTLTGLWHGASWNFVLWGLLFGAMLLLEKWIPALQRLPGVVRHGYVLLVVLLSFVLFNGESLTQAGTDFAGLLGFGGIPAVGGETLYHLRSNAILFLVGIIGATPLVKRVAEKMPEKWAAVVEPLAMVGLLLVCSAYLVDGSFNPFLYFRF